MVKRTVFYSLFAGIFGLVGCSSTLNFIDKEYIADYTVAGSRLSASRTWTETGNAGDHKTCFQIVNLVSEKPLSFDLSAPYIQSCDYDGDGRVDQYWVYNVPPDHRLSGLLDLEILSDLERTLFEEYGVKFKGYER